MPSGEIILGDTLAVLPTLAAGRFQTIIADPPYFQVQTTEAWDNAWASPEAYQDWTVAWVTACRRVLRPDGLLYIFGQLGKREHVWLHVCSRLAHVMQFHDMIVWDRAVGYNERSDSFTPQYELVLVLHTGEAVAPYFDKSAVRLPYDQATIERYMRDKRYRDRAARARQLALGKYATNLLRVPSLKGSSREKVGHPTQKPIALIRHLIAASSRPGDEILDPFLGSGTTAVAARELGRRWVGIEQSPAYAEMARTRLATPIQTDDRSV